MTWLKLTQQALLVKSWSSSISLPPPPSFCDWFHVFTFRPHKKKSTQLSFSFLHEAEQTGTTMRTKKRDVSNAPTTTLIPIKKYSNLTFQTRDIHASEQRFLWDCSDSSRSTSTSHFTLTGDFKEKEGNETKKVREIEQRWLMNKRRCHQQSTVLTIHLFILAIKSCLSYSTEWKKKEVGKQNEKLLNDGTRLVD